MKFSICYTLKIIFVHIPRTGGSSMENQLMKQLNVGEHSRFVFEINNPVPNRVVGHYKLSDYSYYVNLDDYYTFSIVRNPWDLLVSYYEYFRKKDKTDIVNVISLLSFEEFIIYLDKLKLKHKVTNFDEWITVGNKSVNFVAKLENLNDDYKIICNQLDIEYKQIVKSNTSTRNTYTEYYNSKTKDIVFNLFKNDIIRYGYEY